VTDSPVTACLIDLIITCGAYETWWTNRSIIVYCFRQTKWVQTSRSCASNLSEWRALIKGGQCEQHDSWRAAIIQLCLPVLFWPLCQMFKSHVCSLQHASSNVHWQDIFLPLTAVRANVFNVCLCSVYFTTSIREMLCHGTICYICPKSGWRWYITDWYPKIYTIKERMNWKIYVTWKFLPTLCFNP